MNWDQVAGRWNELKGRIKEWWGRPTEDEVEMAEGDLDRFIQQKYGVRKEEVKRQVNTGLSGFDKKE